MNKVVIRLAHAKATVDFGRCLGEALVAVNGEASLTNSPQLAVLLLYGDLGSGKTTFVRGLVATLPGGENAEVSSPSFTLCNVYPTQPELVHCDLYRSGAELPEEAEQALEAGHLVVVEWAERLGERPEEGGVPASHLDIFLQSCENKRLATVTPHGEAAVQVLAACRERWEGSPFQATEKD